MKFENVSFEGTAAQFEECGVKINGQFTTKVSIAALAKHGLVQTVGFGAKPLRGKSPVVFKAIPRDGFTVSFIEQPKTVAEIESANTKAKLVANAVKALQQVSNAAPDTSISDIVQAATKHDVQGSATQENTDVDHSGNVDSETTDIQNTNTNEANEVQTSEVSQNTNEDPSPF